MGTRWCGLLALLAVLGCRSTPGPTEGPREASATPESRATEMPESLRCRVSADCVQKPSCYWETPACVASASVVEEKCGDDADPKNKGYPPVACECFEGQCTPK